MGFYVSRPLLGAFDVLTIFQSGPLLTGLDDQLVLLQVVLVWLPIFVFGANIQDLLSQLREAEQIFIPPFFFRAPTFLSNSLAIPIFMNCAPTGLFSIA